MLNEACNLVPDMQRVQDGTLPTSYTTRVLDDAFHFMQRLIRLLLKSHSAFDSFVHDFSRAIFLCDQNDERKVRAVVEAKGLSWEYYQRGKSHHLHKRIRRIIPDPKTLHKRLTTLFLCYQDVRCVASGSNKSRAGAKLFSPEAVQMSKRLLQTVALGFLSDPPGIPLYYVMGTDRDGLTLYRTIRGTNSVEGGVHMAIRRTFGSLQASPEMSEATIINWVGRRNATVSHVSSLFKFTIMIIGRLAITIALERTTMDTTIPG
jgi:hypothetical protein